MRGAVTTAWRELVRRDRVLAYTGLLHAVLFGVVAALAVVDDRQITGLNRWVKPMKFAASVAAYTWTMGWFLGYLKGARVSARVISAGIALCMVGEIFCVVLQAARGKISHFNTDPGIDGALFSLMGLLIVANTLLVLYTLVLFCWSRVDLPPACLWGIRLGIAIFLVAGLEGFVMTGQRAHTVGLKDGGPGLPLLNWSTAGGDLRVAHFIGLHALQLVPLAGFWLNGRGRTPILPPVAWTAAVAAAYALVAVGLFLQAMRGQPLLAIGDAPRLVGFVQTPALPSDQSP
jgi:hypothetical protein